MIIIDDFSSAWKAEVRSHLIFVALAPAPDPGKVVWLLVAPAPAPAKSGIISMGGEDSMRRQMIGAYKYAKVPRILELELNNSVVGNV